MSESRTYEMLWDCKFCGQRKLLGKTHRHCPNCGAPQDHTARYYPADNEKVAVENHRFVGADRRCGSCGEASSAAAKHCGNCGAPLADAGAVATRSDRVDAEGAARDASGAGIMAAGASNDGRSRTGGVAGAKGGSKRVFGCGGVVGLAILAGFLLFFFWKQPATMEVTGHSWTRSIEIESLQTVQEGAWCDELPAGARVLGREKRERSKKQVADGEDCSLRKKDQGDGTFTEVRECKPKYRDEPVLGEYCRFAIDRWKAVRTDKASGTSLAETPAWPDAKPEPAGQCLGCERLGKRDATYTLHLRNKKTGSAEECSLDEGAWRAYSVGQKVDAEVRRLGAGLDCSSLEAAK